jgi:hypothetical protein
MMMEHLKKWNVKIGEKKFNIMSTGRCFMRKTTSMRNGTKKLLNIGIQGGRKKMKKTWSMANNMENGLHIIKAGR